MENNIAAAQPESISRLATAPAHRNSGRKVIGISLDAYPA
jgi:hypothetical protein